MASSISDSIHLTKYGRFLVRSYRWYHSAALIIVLSYFIALQMGALTILYSFYRSLIIFAIPAYLSAILCVFFARLMGEEFRLRTNMFLSLAVLFFVSLGYSSINLGAHIFHIETREALIVLIAYGGWIRYAYVAIMILPGRPSAIVLAVTQPVISIVGYAALYGIGISEAELFLLTLLLALVLSHLFIKLIDIGLRKGTDGAGLNLIRWMVEYEMGNSERAKEGLEKIFTVFSEATEIHMNFIGFSRRRGNIGMLVHTAHPGPFGTTGGGNLPQEINQSVNGWEILNPHGPSSHDFNPVSQKEKEKLITAVREMILSGLEKSGAAPPITQKRKYADISIRLVGQRFGNTLLVTETFAPDETEDVDPSIAYIAGEKTEYDLALVDAHNSCTSSAKKVDFGSPHAHAIIDSISEISRRKQEDANIVKAGIGMSVRLNSREDIGPEGIKALVVDTDGIKMAYILLDGNNMVPGLREKILQRISGKVEMAEVLTTDNHIVNTVSSGYNPIGVRDGDAIEDECERVVVEAIADMEEAEVLTSYSTAEISVFGSCTLAKILAASRTIAAIFAVLVLMDAWIAFVMALFLALIL